MGEKTGFSAAAVLKESVAKVTVRLGEFSLDELDALEKAEKARGGDARTSLLRALQAEIDTRLADAPAAALSPAAVERLFDATLEILPEQWAAILGYEAGEQLTAAQNAAGLGIVQDLLAGGGEPREGEASSALRRAVTVIGKLLLELAEATAAPLPEKVAAKTVALAADPDKRPKVENLLGAARRMAFCEREIVRFSLPVMPDDFTVHLRKAAFNHRVPLLREKPRVAIDRVALLDDTGRPLADCRWPTPLVGGGGILAVFPALYIGFDL